MAVTLSFGRVPKHPDSVLASLAASRSAQSELPFPLARIAWWETNLVEPSSALDGLMATARGRRRCGHGQTSYRSFTCIACVHDKDSMPAGGVEAIRVTPEYSIPYY